MNTIEYIRHRGWDEKGIAKKFFSSSKGIPVTAIFMMEAYADYKVEQALRIHGVVGQSEQLCQHDRSVTNRICDDCGSVITYVPDDELA